MKRKRKEYSEQERAVEAIVRQALGSHFKEMEFFYYRETKGIFVTYTDYIRDTEVTRMLIEATGGEWKVVAKREFSDANVMLTLLKLFKENRVAIVDRINGRLCPYTIREYVHWLMDRI